MTKGYEPLISTQVILGLSLGLVYILLSLYVSHCWSFLAQSSLSIGSIPIVQGDFWPWKAQIRFRNSTEYSNGGSSLLANGLDYSCIVKRALRLVGHRLVGFRSMWCYLFKVGYQLLFSSYIVWIYRKENKLPLFLLRSISLIRIKMVHQLFSGGSLRFGCRAWSTNFDQCLCLFWCCILCIRL